MAGTSKRELRDEIAVLSSERVNDLIKNLMVMTHEKLAHFIREDLIFRCDEAENHAVACGVSET